MQARQDELRERFYPKPVSPQCPLAAELLKRFEQEQAQKQKQAQPSPDLPGKSIGYYARIVLLVIVVVRLLAALMR